MAKNKVYPSALQAVADIPRGAVIMLGGFGSPGLPQALVRALLEQGARDLTVICNTCFPATDERVDVAHLVEAGRVKKVITTFPGNPTQEVPAVDMLRRGEMEVEVLPQGILAERIRAAAAGLGGLYLPNGVGTVFEEGCEKRTFDGREHILFTPLRADFALVGAHKADPMGNLVYRLSQRNYNPTMAAAADVTIAEVREVVEVGALDPERVVTPGIYVDRLVVSNGDGEG